jgi:hypothetical protein
MKILILKKQTTNFSTNNKRKIARAKMTKCLNVLRKPGQDGGGRKLFGKGIAVPRKTGMPFQL